MTRKFVFLLWMCGTVALGQTASTADTWKPLRFLIGTWEAKTSGGSAGAASTGDYSFRLDLREHILSRHTAGGRCKGPADYNCEHQDLLYVYPEGPNQFAAIYFDNEGHVIRYRAEIPAANSVVFLSEASQPGPQYRLSYELKGGIMYGKFQIRAPGQQSFASYLEWSGRKAR